MNREKQLRAILDIGGAKPYEQMITEFSDLLEQVELESRIDELKKVPREHDYFTAIITHKHVEKRITELSKQIDEGRGDSADPLKNAPELQEQSKAGEPDV